jgi:excinuclease UvrABC ATPase subunit
MMEENKEKLLGLEYTIRSNQTEVSRNTRAIETVSTRIERFERLLYGDGENPGMAENIRKIEESQTAIRNWLVALLTAVSINIAFQIFIP